MKPGVTKGRSENYAVNLNIPLEGGNRYHLNSFGGRGEMTCIISLLLFE